MNKAFRKFLLFFLGKEISTYKAKKKFYLLHGDENMTQILKFIYTLIIFLSLFLVETNSGMSSFTPFSIFQIYLTYNINQLLKIYYFFLSGNTAPKPCVTVKDCPKTVFPIGYKCIKNLCILVI